ncbi:hypothetical protein JW921_09480, partial [Candidatus Fermentibacterales bacterium]|nr:hypothetical protein [Candidatus Fermentibacterales bacterium]
RLSEGTIPRAAAVVDLAWAAAPDIWKQLAQVREQLAKASLENVAHFLAVMGTQHLSRRPDR